jgi:hypothetical protein
LKTTLSGDLYDSEFEEIFGKGIKPTPIEYD